MFRLSDSPFQVRVVTLMQLPDGVDTESRPGPQCRPIPAPVHRFLSREIRRIFAVIVGDKHTAPVNVICQISSRQSGLLLSLVQNHRQFRMCSDFRLAHPRSTPQGQQQNQDRQRYDFFDEILFLNLPVLRPVNQVGQV